MAEEIRTLAPFDGRSDNIFKMFTDTFPPYGIDHATRLGVVSAAAPGNNPSSLDAPPMDFCLGLW
jgi:hypothetical protein